MDGPRWRCLENSMWSQIPAVQVLAIRLLRRHPAPWARETLESVYLDPEVAAWADEA